MFFQYCFRLFQFFFRLFPKFIVILQFLQSRFLFFQRLKYLRDRLPILGFQAPDKVKPLQCLQK